MNMTTPIKQFIWRSISPRLTSFYSRLGFPNRGQLTTNIRKAVSRLDDPSPLIETLARHQVIKWRFRDTGAAEFGEHSLCGRTEMSWIHDALNELEASNTYDNIGEIKASVLSGLPPVGSGLSQNINQGVKLAFALGTISAIGTGIALTSASVPAMLAAGSAFLLFSGIFAGRFNPHFMLGKIFRFGRRLFNFSLVLTSIASATLMVTYLNKMMQHPWINTNQIEISSSGPAVLSRVCQNRSLPATCVTTKLFEHTVPYPDQRAQVTAERLQQSIDNNNLYWGALGSEGERLLITHRYLPGWVPNSTTTLLDLSHENLSRSERYARFASFLDNLYTSGIMPSSKKMAEIAAARAEANLPWMGYRDPRLAAYLELATYYLSLKQYDKAIAACQVVLSSDTTVTSARAMYADECAFLTADAYRILSLRTWSSRYLDQALDVLLTNQAKLRRLETGYQTRYDVELATTCGFGSRFFPRATLAHRADCLPEKIAEYGQRATFGLNRFTPAFNDNFLAMRAFLGSGSYHLSNRDIDLARQYYEQALGLAQLIDSCSAVSTGNTAQDWKHYGLYLNGADQKIDGLLGHRAALWSYARRCEIGRILRGDLVFTNLSKQFDAKYFKVFKAQAYQGLANVEFQLARQDRENMRAHILKALDHMQIAHDIVKDIQSNNLYEFYLSMFEERMTYYDVLTDYAKALMYAYSLGEFSDVNTLETVETLVQEAMGQRAEDKTDVIYLKALLIKGEVEFYRNDVAAATKTLNDLLSITMGMQLELKPGDSLPPLFAEIRAEAEIKLKLVNSF